MFKGFFVLLCFDLSGEVLQRALHIPLSGPLIGMVLLTAVLLLRSRVATKSLSGASRWFTSNMALFFVPAGVGVITQLDRIRSEWRPTVLALLGSTFASMLVSGLVMQWIAGKHGDGFVPPEGGSR